MAIAVGLGLLAWSAVAAVRGDFVAGCVAFLVLAACFGYQLVSFEVGPYTLTLDRVALAIMIAVFGVQRWRGRTEPKPLTRADLALGAFLAFLVLRMLTADGSTPEPAGPSRWRLAAGYLMPASLYWMARESPLGERRLAAALITLLGFGIYLALTGVLEIAQLWRFVFPPHIADPTVGSHFGRARGPMAQSVSFGIYVCAGLVSAWLLLARWRTRGRVFALAALPLFLAAVFFSYTRSVWIGAAFGALVACSLTLTRIGQRVLAAVVIASLLLAAITLKGFIGFQRGSETSSMTAMSVEMRLGLAWVSWRMFLDHPLVGVGFGTFPTAKLPHLENGPESLNLEAIRPLAHHNHYLSLLTETGTIGLALFLAVLASWAALGLRMWRRPSAPAPARTHCVLLLSILGIFLVQWMFHELSYTPIDHGLLFLVAGITVGLGSPPRTTDRTGPSGESRSAGRQSGPGSPDAPRA